MNLENQTLNSSTGKTEQEVSKMLEQELAKPYQKRDYDKIEALLNEYTALNHLDEQIEKATEHGIQTIIAQSRIRKPRIKRYRHLLTATVLALILVTANVISVAAVDENIFSVIINFGKTNFSVNFFSAEVSEENIIQLPITEDDPYGIIARCAENDIYPETPHYLPEGYVLTLCNYVDMPQFCRRMKFTFKNQNNKNQSICFMYDFYDKIEDISTTKFSNIEHNLTEIKVNEKTAILAEEKEDKQFTIVYHLDNLLISIFTQDMPIEEVYKIVASIK